MTENNPGKLQEKNPDGDRRAWERQRYEPLRWYARFERYRLLDPLERTIQRAWEAERAELEAHAEGGQATQGGPPRSWYRAARRWRWRERAEVWDQHRLAQTAQAAERTLQLFREYGLKAAQTLIDLLDSDSDVQRHRSAVAILDRIKAGAPEEEEQAITPITMVEVVRSEEEVLSRREIGSTAEAAPADHGSGG